MNVALLLGLASALGYGITDYLAGIAGRAVGVWRSIFYSDLAAFIVLSACSVRPCGEACAFASHQDAWIAALGAGLVLVAAAAIVMLSHPKPAPPPAFGGPLGSQPYSGVSHGHGHGHSHGPSCR